MLRQVELDEGAAPSNAHDDNHDPSSNGHEGSPPRPRLLSSKAPYEWKDYETSRNPYPNSWLAELRFITAREWLFVLRDKRTLRARLIQSLLLGALQGTIYWMVSPDAVHTRFGSLYQVMIVTAFRSISTFSATFYRRPLFYKQHGNEGRTDVGAAQPPPPPRYDDDDDAAACPYRLTCLLTSRRDNVAH
jgi:hypothetical protein